jgi:hypothetical protein
MQFQQQGGKGQLHLYLLVGKVQHLAIGTQWLSRSFEIGETCNLVGVLDNFIFVQGQF